MKRKASPPPEEASVDIPKVAKKARVIEVNVSKSRKPAGRSSTEAISSPRRVAFSRKCRFEKNDKVIGFYGGWPYTGSVGAVEQVNMSFGSTYVVLVRWNGFSGKNAMTWLSEFDIMKADEVGLQAKTNMEKARRDLVAAAGGKVDRTREKKIFLQVVSEFRGKRLAPFAPMTSSYPDDWQMIVRITAMPKSLIDHLAQTEELVYERRLSLFDTTQLKISRVLSDWSEGAEDKNKYCECLKSLLVKFLFPVLLYKAELPFATQALVGGGNGESAICEVFPVEYLVRLVNMLPEILTAATGGVLSKPAGNGSVLSLLRFASVHQSFLAYLDSNIETLLRTPVRLATLDEAVPESAVLAVIKRSASEPCAMEQGMDHEVGEGESGKKVKLRSMMHKRKHAKPVLAAVREANPVE